jgi:hypothetical protein
VNAGRDYLKAKRQAQANADYTQTPRWLHLYGGVWWITKTQVHDGELIRPDEEIKPSTGRMGGGQP